MIGITSNLNYWFQYLYFVFNVDEKTVQIYPAKLKELICDEKYKTLMSPIIFIVDGLPDCGKSDALTKLLRTLTRNDAKEKVNESAGISYYELAAVGKPPAPFNRLTYAETNKESCYLYAFQSALKHFYYSCGQEIIFHGHSTDKVEKFFDDKDLDEHFYRIFKSLATNQQQELSSHLATNWNLGIPSGIALINVWDIGMNKAAFHFLPALWGHLDNSYLWLFLHLDRDVSELYNAPKFPEFLSDKIRNDLIMQYRSTIEYLLRPAMLAKGLEGDRKDVCSVFGVHSGTYDESQLDSLLQAIRNASARANLATVINTKEVTPINPNDPKCCEVLKRKVDEIVGAKLQSKLEIPLASIFLRSLYYGVDTMYIKRSELNVKAKLLNITDDEFKKFCKVFMSLGSIIDVSLIDKNSDYVILRPTVFICRLDKIFYPDTIDPRVAKCGIVTKSTAEEIFDTDHQFFMDVLVSVDLAIKLKSYQIRIESSEFTQVEESEECYYIPDVRMTDPDLKCQPSALHLLYSTNSPLRHLQVLFARALLDRKKDSQLVFSEASHVNITKFKVFTSHTRDPVDFEMCYLGEAIEFRVPPEADEDICTTIIQSCHEIMKSKWGCEKYNFAVMCSNDPNPSTPSRLQRMCHFLPDETLCEACVQQYTQDKMLSKWINILREVSSLKK